MLDVLVSQVVLNRSGIIPIVRQLEHADVAQHAGVGRETEAGLPPCPGDQLANRRICHRPLALGDEDILGRRVVPFQPAQRPNLGTAQGMGAGVPFFLLLIWTSPASRSTWSQRRAISS